MNNEPVAWMYKDKENGMVSFLKETLPFDAIPLYTHPVKELTDEEITQCLNESMDIKNVWGHPMLELNPVNFARAILKKAQE